MSKNSFHYRVAFFPCHLNSTGGGWWWFVAIVWRWEVLLSKLRLEMTMPRRRIPRVEWKACTPSQLSIKNLFKWSAFVSILLNPPPTSNCNNNVCDVARDKETPWPFKCFLPVLPRESWPITKAFVFERGLFFPTWDILLLFTPFQMPRLDISF